MTTRVWIDLEYGDRIISQQEKRMPSLLEIGCMITGDENREFSLLVKPLYERDVTERISGITSRSLEDYKKGVAAYEAINSLNQFLAPVKGADFFAWGTADEAMLRWWFPAFSIRPKFGLRFIDCWSYLKALRPDMPESLKNSCVKFGLAPPSHAALADCYAMANLFFNVTEENESEPDDFWKVTEF